jgi:hypothetical protein
MSVVFWAIIVFVIVGVIAALFGLDRYRGSRQPGADDAAQPTDEVFIDPESGRRMRVWYDQRSGKRDYRPELRYYEM